MSTHQRDLVSEIYKKINNSIQIFFDDTFLYTSADELDKTIFDSLIVPRTKEMIAVLNASDDVVHIQSKSYHVNDELKFSLSKDIYCSVKKNIIHSYNNYY